MARHDLCLVVEVGMRMMGWRMMMMMMVMMMMMMTMMVIMPVTAGETEREMTLMCGGALEAELERLTAETVAAGSTWAYGLSYATPGSPLITGKNTDILTTVASNTKLLTTSAVLLGAQELEGGLEEHVATWVGGGNTSVCVRAVGDPSVVSGQVEALGEHLVGLLGKVGEKVDISVSTGFIPGQDVYPPTWELDDFVYAYGASINAAMVNENNVVFNISSGPGEGGKVSVLFAVPTDALTTTVSTAGIMAGEGLPLSVSARYVPGDPVLYLSGTMPVSTSVRMSNYAGLKPDNRFFQLLAAGVQKAGGIVGSASITPEPCVCDVDDGCNPYLASINSTTLRDLIHHTLLVSDNTYAEMFLRWLGNNVFNGTLSNIDTDAADLPASAMDAGLDKVKWLLGQGGLGVDPQSFFQADGSGVSRRNLISVSSLLHLLREMTSDEPGKGQDALFPLLPVGGVSGTLASRFVDTVGQGRVHAKTGTLTGVNALSGYINRTGLGTDSSRQLVFSIVNFGSPLRSSQTRPIIDSMVLAMMQISDACPYTPLPTPSPSSSSKVEISKGGMLGVVLGSVFGGFLLGVVVVAALLYVRKTHDGGEGTGTGGGEASYLLRGKAT